MRILLLILALLTLVAVPVLSAGSDTGAELFAANCASCHGPQGKGDGAAGAALNPRPADLTQRPYKYGCCETMIGKTLTSGVHGTAMPSFASTLTDAQRSALAGYVATLQTDDCGDCPKADRPRRNRACCPKG